MACTHQRPVVTALLTSSPTAVAGTGGVTVPVSAIRVAGMTLPPRGRDDIG
jgi:hypothetical protein